MQQGHSGKPNRIGNYEAGRRAEWLAALFLCLRLGAWPCNWRYKTPVGEIDWVLRTRTTILFVEVKKRATHEAALASIEARGQARIRRAASVWLQQAPARLREKPCRFDVVALDSRWRPRHVPDAF